MHDICLIVLFSLLQPSLLFSNIGLKTQRVPAYNTTDFNSAIRYFTTETKLTCTTTPACHLQVPINEICNLSLPAMCIFREFYHDTNVQLIGSCTSAPQFCLTTGELLLSPAHICRENSNPNLFYQELPPVKFDTMDDHFVLLTKIT
jgi:hypothetical protein